MDQLKRNREIGLLDYWNAIVKRRWVIIAFTGTLVFFTGVFSFLATPKYKATAALLIEEETSKILNIEETFRPQSPARDLRFFNTQIKLLRSKTLAQRVVEKMNITSRPEFKRGRTSKKSMLASIKDLLTLKWLRARISAEENPKNLKYPINPFSDAAEVILKGIEVKPVRETKLVEVSYTSPSPVLAAEIVNKLTEEYINFSIEKRFEITQQASDYLSEQIANLRDEMEMKERELQRYSQEKELFFLNDETESTQINTFKRLNDAYTQAKIDRINAEAVYRERSSLKIDSFPQFVDNPVIQQLITEYSKKKNEYEENLKFFKPEWPDMIKLKAGLNDMEATLKGEIRKAVQTVESDYRSKLNNEEKLRQELEKQKEDVIRMNSNAILYEDLNIEVQNMRKVLNTLLERQKETLVSSQLGDLEMGNITIIDAAEISKKPVSPKKKLSLFLALLFGLCGGIGLCFLLEYLDNTLKSPEDVERLADIPSLGIVPYLPIDGMGRKGRHAYYQHSYRYGDKDPDISDTLVEIKEVELVNHHYPDLFISEDYRAVRTSILLSHPENPPQTIVFSSAMPQEGKSSTAVNMAVSFSQLEKKILVVDADLRKPRLHKIFKVRNMIGLSGYLTGMTAFENTVQPTSIPNIWLLPSGLIPPHPAELLNSKKMQELMKAVKQDYDFVVIDTSPVLAVSDPIIVASLADMTVFVVKTGKTTDKQFLKSIDELKKAKVKMIGVVFNGMNTMSRFGEFQDFYQHYYYQDSSCQQNHEDRWPE